MGGLGKTTIAKQVFAKNFSKYDRACFFENVRVESPSFAQLRDKLLSELLERPITTSGVFGLHTFNKVRLSNKKVFIVLDDVIDTEQLDDIFKELGDLGQESKLIITTRDKHILKGRVHEIYKVTNWETKESEELFYLHAFKKSHPKECYEHLSDRAISYAGGVPLALKVLGSYFYSRNLKFWESKLSYLENKEESLDKIQNVLRVSYDGLSGSEKDIFLDIAFFFKDENEDFVTKVLDACNFNATCGIQILRDKALITISYDKKIQLHDLLQEMAFNIVRYNNGCASSDRIKRSRLRDIVEVCDTLKESHNIVEGILFDLSQKVDLHVRADTFNKMTKLRYLRLYAPVDTKRLATMSLPEDIMPFSDKLRYFEWNGYPLKSLPQPFFARLLVEIRLPHSNVEHLWHGVQELERLEGIDLSECKQLIKLPDFSAAPKLKRLYLSGCESLCEFPPSIFSNDTLVTLLLDRCTNLQSLISEKHLTSLQKLNVDGCISLKEFSLSSSSIDRLDLSKTGIEILHASIRKNNKLVSLNLEGLRLQNLPRDVCFLSLLSILHLSNCSIVTKSELEAIFNDGLKSLKVLHLKYCCNLFELPSNISSLASSLCDLRLDSSNVRMLPTSIKELLKLKVLYLDNCIELCCLPELPPHIRVLHADNCISLMTVSTLKTFSTRMTGGKKDISFKNCSKMELDRPSLNRNKEDAILMMKIVAYRNIEVRKSPGSQGYIHNSAGVCFPGSIVPRQFEYISHGSSSETIEVDNSNLLGFIFSIVVSPSHKMKGSDNKNDAFKIKCQCYSQYGRKVGYASMSQSDVISNLNMDHLFVWYNPHHFSSINLNFRTVKKISFEFCIMAETQEEKVGNLFSIKECGVFPIYCSEFPRLLDLMNLDNGSTSKLYEDRFQLKKLESDESYQEREEDSGIKLIEVDDEVDKVGRSTHIKNLDLDLNKKSHHLYDSSIVSEGTQVTDNTREKEIQDDDGNGLINSEREIVKFLPYHKELKCKGNEEIPTESVAGFMHLPIVSVVEENAYINKSNENIYGRQDSLEETKHVEGNSNMQGEQIIVPKGEEDVPDVMDDDDDEKESLYDFGCRMENLVDSILGDIELEPNLQERYRHNYDDGVFRDIVDIMASLKEVAHNIISKISTQETEKGRREIYDKNMKEPIEKVMSLKKEIEMQDEKYRILVEQRKNIELEKGQLKERMEKCEAELKILDDEATNMIIQTEELRSSHDAALQNQQELEKKWAFADNFGT